MFSSCPNPPVWSPLPSCLDNLPFTSVFVPKAGVETVLEVTWLWSHSPRMFLKAQFPPLPLWKWCAHLGTLFVAAGAQFECVSLPLHSRTAHPPLILGSPPFPSLSPVWSYILLLSALPMKRKGIVARSTVSDRPK